MTGRPDIILGSYSHDTITVFTNRANEQPGAHSPVILDLATVQLRNGHVMRLAVGDITGSGWPAICAAGTSNSPSCLITTPTAPGNFSASPMEVSVPNTLAKPTAMTLADVTGDGLLDMLVADTQLRIVFVNVNGGQAVDVPLDTWLSKSPFPLASAPAVFSLRALQPGVNHATMLTSPSVLRLVATRANYTINRTWVLAPTPRSPGMQVLVIVPQSGLTVHCCVPTAQCITVWGNATIRAVGGPLRVLGCPTGQKSHIDNVITDTAAVTTLGTALVVQYSRVCQFGYGRSFCPSEGPVFRNSFPSLYFPGPPRVGGNTLPPSPFLTFANHPRTALAVYMAHVFRAFSWRGMTAVDVRDCHATLAATGGGVSVSGVVSGELHGWHFEHNHGGSGGGLSATDSFLTLENCTFTSNTATNGGALSIAGRGSVTAVDVSFLGNSATANGGAVVVANAVMMQSFRNVFASHNKAQNHGGFMFSAGTPILIDSSTVQDNIASASGGALRLEGTSSMQWRGGTATGNRATHGGMVSVFQSFASLTQVEAVGNFAWNGGGAMHILFGKANLFNVTFRDNSAGQVGGALYCVGVVEENSGITSTSTTYRLNRATSGGAIHVTACPLVSSADTFDSNIALPSAPVQTVNFLPKVSSGKGGAIALFNPAQHEVPLYVLDRSTIVNCSAHRFGGALYVSVSRTEYVSIQRGSITNCRALGGGGGAIYSADAIPNVADTTLSGNSALYGPDHASSARFLHVVQDYVSSLSQESGQIFDGALTLALKDHFGATVLSESFTSVELLSSALNQTVLQSGITKAHQGVFNATQAFALLAPNFNVSYDLTWNLVGPAATYGDGFAVKYPPPLRVRIGPCGRGLVWSPGSRRCTPCPPGTFAGQVGATACVNCGPGTFSAASGAATCDRCQRPLYAQHNRSTVCTQCSPGLYWVSASAPCEPCPGNQIAIAGVCSCPPHSVRQAGPDGVHCTECNAIPGAYCPSNATNLMPSQLEAIEGFWHVPQSTQFISCPFPSSCGHQGCSKFSGGPCCMTCQHGYYRDFSGTCKECPGSAATSLVVLSCVAFVITTAIMVLYMHRTVARWTLMEVQQRGDGGNRRSHAVSVAFEAHAVDEEQHKANEKPAAVPVDDELRKHSDVSSESLMVPHRSQTYQLTALFKIVIGHVQILALVVTAGGGASVQSTEGGGGFPHSLRHFAQYVGLVILRITRFVPLACTSSQPFELGIVLTLLLPIALVAAVAVASVVLYLLRQRWSQHPLSWHEVYHRAVKAVSVLLVLVYPLTTAELLEAFYHRTCAELFDAVGVDAGLDTSSSSYHTVQVLSALGLCVYTIGIPLAFATLLVGNKDNLWNPDSPVALKYAFLYQDLHPSRWWWFPVSMLEKVLYAFTAVFLAQQVFEQYALEVLLTVGSAMALAVLEPYTGIYQLLLLSSRLVIFLTIFGSLVLQRQGACESATDISVSTLCNHRYHVDEPTVSGLLIALNCLVVLVPCGVLVMWCRARRCCVPRSQSPMSLKELRQSLL